MYQTATNAALATLVDVRERGRDHDHIFNNSCGRNRSRDNQSLARGGPKTTEAFRKIRPRIVAQRAH